MPEAAGSCRDSGGKLQREPAPRRHPVFAVENNKGLFKGSGSDDVLREKFTRQLKWCTDVMDVFAP